MKKKILSILLMGILVISLTGCGKVKETKNKNSSTKSTTDIVESFANYINSNDFQTDDPEDIKVTFIKTEENKNPMMFVTYKIVADDGEDMPFSEILYFNEEGVLNDSGSNFNSYDIKVLYDIENDKYIWSLYELLEDQHFIIPLKEFINKNDNPTVLKSEEFNKKYVVTDLKTEPVIIDDIKDLKKTFFDLLSDNKINIITDDMKETVKTKVEEIKKKEEEASKVINVGNYTLQYGYYKNMNTISAAALDITINPDNTCTYQTDNQEYGTDTCTYEIKEYSGTEFDGSYVSGYHIIFHISGQSDKYFNVTDNNTFIDQSAELKYIGEKKE